MRPDATRGIDRPKCRARGDLGALGIAAMIALGGAAACAAPSAGADYARIERLSGVDLPPRATAEEMDPEPAPEARALLARPLDADAAVRVAIANNRALRAALREVGIARGELVQAGLLPNPEIEAALLPPQTNLASTRVEVTVEYALTRALLAPMRERAAEADVEAARYRAAGAVVDLGYEVRAAFYAAQAAEQRLAIANRALDTFAAARDAARALLEAGNIAELDAATEEAAYESARVTAAQMELERIARRERLVRLLGLAGADTAFRLEEGVRKAPEDVTTPPRAETRALTASLELAETRSRIRAAEARAGLARTAGWLPDMSVGVQGEREDAAWRVGARLAMTVPIFDRKQGTTAAHVAELDALLERYHGLAVDVRSALRETRSRLESAHARARHFERVVLPARRRVLEQAILQYNAMQIGIFPLLEARRDVLEAELAEVETLRELWTAKAAFDALLAGGRVAALGTTAASGAFASARGATGEH